MATPFDHLTPTEFEEFCFELIKSVGFINIDWRKGTPKPASPADGGRDIVGERLIKDEIDGSVHIEKYFFECKHHKAGIPPEEIQGALAWASAECPSHLVIIASGFLSNPCKDYLEVYNEKRRPSFRIRYWERPQLEQFLVNKQSLVTRFRIGGMSFVDSLHPAHLQFIRTLTMNTVDQLFSKLDEFPDKDRDKILHFCYVAIIKPKIPKELKIDHAHMSTYIYMTKQYNYEAFKERCFILQLMSLNKRFLCGSIVMTTLASLFAQVDSTKDESALKFQKGVIDEIESALSNQQTTWRPMSEFLRLLEVISIDGFYFNDLQAHLENFKKSFIELASGKRDRSLYDKFCNEVVGKLLEDEIITPSALNDSI